MKNVVNIEEVLEHLDDYQIQQKVNQFKSKIKVRTDKLELLTPDAKAKLKALADSSLNDINFDKYTQLVRSETCVYVFNQSINRSIDRSIDSPNTFN